MTAGRLQADAGRRVRRALEMFTANFNFSAEVTSLSLVRTAPRAIYRAVVFSFNLFPLICFLLAPAG
jgi:hypothetical protein